MSRKIWLCLLLATCGLLGSAQALAQHVHGETPANTEPPVAEAEAGQAESLTESLRDPHAWSGGYVRGAGAYALPGAAHFHSGEERYGSLLMERLEWLGGDAEGMAWDGQAWWGDSFRRVVFKSEGHAAGDSADSTHSRLQYSHAISAFWDLQAGLRLDTDVGPNRAWVGGGIQGLAPWWFEVDSSLWLGEGGHLLLALEADYEWLLSQRWVLQPRIEARIYSEDDPENALGSGLSETVFGLRLRYEINRQIAPYAGVEWEALFGDTADLAESAGHDDQELLWVAGLRFWF